MGNASYEDIEASRTFVDAAYGVLTDVVWLQAVALRAFQRTSCTMRRPFLRGLLELISSAIVEPPRCGISDAKRA